MKGLIVEPWVPRIEIVNGSRIVATTDGTLVCLLPTEQSFSSLTLTFPDFQKDEAYLWTWGVADNPLDSTKFQKGEWCTSMITAKPQEYTSKTVIMAAPPGADFFVGTVKILRTTAPQNSWMGRTLGVLTVQSQWIPWYGSALLEQEVGMARAMHVYIDSNHDLVMEAQQSVGVPVNGYGSFGDPPSISNPFGNGGGEILHNGTPGIPIFKRDAQSYGYTSPPAASNSSPTLLRRSGSNPCARGDTTVYTSVYSVDVKGRFGRRS